MTILVERHEEDNFVALRWGGKDIDRKAFEDQFGKHPTVRREDLFEMMEGMDIWCYDTFGECAQFEVN